MPKQGRKGRKARPEPELRAIERELDHSVIHDGADDDGDNAREPKADSNNDHDNSGTKGAQDNGIIDQSRNGTTSNPEDPLRLVKNELNRDPTVVIHFMLDGPVKYIFSAIPSIEASAYRINTEVEDILRLVDEERAEQMGLYNLSIEDVVSIDWQFTNGQGQRTTIPFTINAYIDWRMRISFYGRHHDVPCTCKDCLVTHYTDPRAHEPFIVLYFHATNIVRMVEVLIGARQSTNDKEEIELRRKAGTPGYGLNER